MIPFPGESIGLSEAAIGATYTGELRSRNGSETLSAGDVCRAWVGVGVADYLESGSEDVTIEWAVEVTSGTVTVTAGEAFDPDYDNTALDPTVSHGSFTATGPTTLLIPSVVTVSQVYDGDGWTLDGRFMLHLAVTSGSAVVQQIKMRVWPSAGVAGGWSDVQPSRETTPTDAVKQYGQQGYTGEAYDAPAAGWDTARAAFYADYTANSGAASRGFGTVPTNPAAKQGMDPWDVGVYRVGWDMVAALVMLTGDDWTTHFPIAGDLVEGVDWIRPPNEISGDFAWYVQRIGDGSTEWVDATISLTDSGDLPGNITLATYGGQWVNDAPGSGTAYTTPAEAGTAVGSGTFPLDTSGPMSLAVVAHSMVTGVADAFPGWTVPTSRQDDVGYTLGPVKSYAVLPPYRVWSPSAVTAAPMRLMQRGDGLGMGSGRVYGLGTRQSSGRVFGPY